MFVFSQQTLPAVLMASHQDQDCNRVAWSLASFKVALRLESIRHDMRGQPHSGHSVHDPSQLSNALLFLMSLCCSQIPQMLESTAEEDAVSRFAFQNVGLVIGVVIMLLIALYESSFQAVFGAGHAHF